MKHFQKIILSFLFAAITFLISANTNVFREQNPESKKVYAENVHKQQELHTVKPQVLFDGEISPEIVWARILTAQPTRSLKLPIYRLCNTCHSAPKNYCLHNTE